MDWLRQNAGTASVLTASCFAVDFDSEAAGGSFLLPLQTNGRVAPNLQMTTLRR